MWSGNLRLALVSVPVKLYPATKTGARISFHQVHEPSGKRIRYEKVVPGLGPVDTDDIVKGFEKIKGVTLGGLMPPLEITPADHEGGGWVQVFTVKGGKLAKQTDWFRAYPEVLKKHIEADAKKS